MDVKSHNSNNKIPAIVLISLLFVFYINTYIINAINIFLPYSFLYVLKKLLDLIYHD